MPRLRFLSVAFGGETKHKLKRQEKKREKSFFSEGGRDGVNERIEYSLSII